MGIDAVGVEERLQQEVVYHLGRQNGDGQREHDEGHGRPASHESHAHQQAYPEAEPRSHVGNHVEHPDDKSDKEGVLGKVSAAYQGDGDHKHHDGGLGEYPDEIAREQR